MKIGLELMKVVIEIVGINYLTLTMGFCTVTER